MINRSTCFASVLCITSLVTSPAVTWAQGEETTELGSAMEDMNSAYRRLNRQIGDPEKNADSLERVALLQSATEKSLELIPLMAEELPPARRSQFVESYRADMKQFLLTVTKLKAALVANDNDTAKALFAEIKAMRKDGHEAYKKED